MNDFTPDFVASVGHTKDRFIVAEESAPLVSPDKVILRDTENAEDSVRRLLAVYDIGNKLRHLRLRKKIALVDLGRHTGLSASMLSQLENGKLVPTLPTLARIATVFDVGLEHFFTDRKSKLFSVVRADERLRFPESPDSAIPGYFFEVLAFGATDKSMSAYLADFPPREAATNSRLHCHEGSEFVFVLNGLLAINYQAEEHILHAGDSVYFDASEPHSYIGRSTENARALVVTSLPRL